MCEIIFKTYCIQVLAIILLFLYCISNNFINRLTKAQKSLVFFMLKVLILNEKTNYNSCDTTE